MGIQLFCGSMYSSKTKNLLERAEILELRKVPYVIFYPSSCSNGEKESVYSRANIRKSAIALQEIIDIYQHIKIGTKAILIDELQFIGKTENDVNDLINFIKYCEKNKIDLYFSGLDLDFKGEPFIITQSIMPFCDQIHKLKAVCMHCLNEEAKYSLRTKDGKPCSFTEEVLIERHNVEYSYIPVCPDCFHLAYNNLG